MSKIVYCIFLFFNYNILIFYIIYYSKDNKNFFLLFIFQWGLGIGDWGLGIGVWGLGAIPNPQAPNPDPQTPN